uniref:Endophilin-A2 n=1 Tax=Urocitellus parryii TaxID=9999 RepID=A0A8D2HER6_UROPR
MGLTPGPRAGRTFPLALQWEARSTDEQQIQQQPLEASAKNRKGQRSTAVSPTPKAARAAPSSLLQLFFHCTHLGARSSCALPILFGCWGVQRGVTLLVACLGGDLGKQVLHRYTLRRDRCGRNPHGAPLAGPVAASRAKLTMLNTVSKIRGQVKNPGYPQSEGLLGECMIRHGKELGGESNFGDALLDAGESMKRLAEVKDSLDIEVKQNFIDPLQNLCDKDLKEIQHHLKKLEGRRLDFDYKKKRQGKIPDEELRQALEKFEESKEVAETSMHNLLETDIEQVSQLSALVDAQLDYHRQAVQILDELADKLRRRVRDASSRPKREYKPKPREPFDLGEPEQSNGGFPCTTAPKTTASSSFRSSDKPIRTPSRSMPPLDQPSCKALYDFEPENDGELGFREGDLITLTNQIDENWYEGMLHGQSGFFPLSYVEVLVPLPQ